MLKIIGRALMAAAAGLTLTGQSPAQSISDNEVVIGAMVDMTGVYSANGGPGAVVAAQMAVEDYGGSVLGKPIRLLSANYQNRVDVANNLARQWFDQDHVDMIVESTDSASAIAIQGIGADKGRITIAAGSASTALTNKNCSPLGIHYVYDTYALAVGTGNAIFHNGGKTWFFITADYAFGLSLEENTANVVKSFGGKVLGDVRHPLGSSDFSSYLLQAQSSGAQVVAFANAGADFSTAVKQSAEFGIVESGQTIAGMLVFITDLKALGLQIAKGLNFTTGFYWDYNDETRAFARRFFERHRAMPTMIQAGIYSAVTYYLNAIKATQTDDAATVRKWMGENKINDFFAKNGYIRKDGRMVHTMYLAAAKAPSESKGEWDLAKITREIPGEEAYLPLEKSACPLVQK